MNRYLSMMAFLGALMVSLIGSNAWAVSAEDLGKVLLGESYAGINLGFNQYYSGGPTSDSTFGGWHPGIDYAAKTGITVYSPVEGTITSNTGSASMNAIGRVSIDIDGTNEYFIFAHLSSKFVSAGDRVTIGTPIGLTGSVGTAGSHLHVEVREGRSLLAYYFTSSNNTGYNVNPALVFSNEEMADSVFDDIESNYSHWFSPHTYSQTSGQYYYRFYPNGSYLLMWNGDFWYNIEGSGWQNAGPIVNWYN